MISSKNRPKESRKSPPMKSFLRFIVASILPTSASHAVWNTELTLPLPPVPTYSQSQEAIYWTSGSNFPGESVLLNGAFGTEPKHVRLTSLYGVSDVNSALNASSLTVPAFTMGNTGLNFTLPYDFDQGPFAYRVEDNNGLSLVGYGNLPTVYWTAGTVDNLSAQTAPSMDSMHMRWRPARFLSYTAAIFHQLSTPQ